MLILTPSLFTRLSGLFMLLLWLALPAQALSDDSNNKNRDKDKRAVTLEHYKWFGDVPKAKFIRIINPFGGITSRNTSYHNIEMSGVIQKIGQHPASHQIDITDINGVTEVVVSYPNGNKNAEGQLTGRFDLGVWAPNWVTVQMVTDFGDIKVKKHASNIIANSQSGKITIGTAGRVVANSDSGNIKVDFYGVRWHQAMQVSSKTGDVKVKLSQSANLRLEVLSNNPVSNNLADYQQIKRLKTADFRLLALLNQPDTGLQLSAEQGHLSINILDKPTIQIKQTARPFGHGLVKHKAKTTAE